MATDRGINSRNVIEIGVGSLAAGVCPVPL